MSYLFLVGWFIFTITILGTAVLFVLYQVIKGKVEKWKKKKRKE